MGGFFAAASRENCIFDVFFGTDYHSHLGTRRAGMTLYDSKDGYQRAIHNIENSPFRTKFEDEVQEMHGHMGIGCISDYDPQPLLVRSHHGTYAIMVLGRVNNHDELVKKMFEKNNMHFLEMSGGLVNNTELVAALINQKDNLVDGICFAQEQVEGSLSMVLLTDKGIYCARDKMGRTPVEIGVRDDGFAASFEAFAYQKLGYRDYKELGPGEVVVMTPESVTTLVKPGDKMKICTFLWVYYGYPSSRYEGVSVEEMRYRCGSNLAKRDGLYTEDIDTVSGVPDSGVAHAIGYSNSSHVPYSRPFIKYTPTWPRSFMPTVQERRNMIAKMKLVPIHELIDGKRMLLIDDSIVRGTQLRETSDFLFSSGAKEVHARPACPPIMFGCKYINFSRSTSDMELIARRIISREEGEDVSREVLEEYADPDSERYKSMVEGICKQMSFTSLAYNRLDDMLDAVGIDREKLCTYCWNGKE